MAPRKKEQPKKKNAAADNAYIAGAGAVVKQLVSCRHLGFHTGQFMVCIKSFGIILNQF